MVHRPEISHPKTQMKKVAGNRVRAGHQEWPDDPLGSIHEKGPQAARLAERDGEEAADQVKRRRDAKGPPAEQVEDTDVAAASRTAQIRFGIGMTA